MTKTPHGSLGDLLGRLESILSSRELSHDEALDLDGLSTSTGLTKREIRTLLKGGRLRDRPVEEITRNRVKSLYARRHGGDDRKKAAIIVEVADRLGVTRVWARQLLHGEKCPNVPHLKALSTYFEVPVAFFTDYAPDALARELRPIVERLESEGPDPLADLVGEHGIRAIAARNGGRSLTRTQREAIARFVVDFIVDKESGR